MLLVYKLKNFAPLKLFAPPNKFWAGYATGCHRLSVNATRLEK